MPNLKMSFPLRPDFEAWAKRYVAQAVADAGRLLMISDPTGDKETWEASDQDGKEMASGTVRAVETAMLVGHIDQRTKADQRRFLAKQVYDLGASTAKYVIFVGTDYGSLIRLLVDDLDELSLVELAWLFAMERQCVIEVSTPKARVFSREEERAISNHVRDDIYFDVTKDDCKVKIKRNSTSVRVEVEWASEDVPFGLWRMARAMAAKKKNSKTTKTEKSRPKIKPARPRLAR